MLEPARNPLALARYELKRFRGPLPRLALVFILLVPLLYGCIYLAGNWDPYGRLNHVPVAVVNQDRPTSFGDRQITAGDDFVKSLHEAGTFDFRDTEAAEAADGLAHGRYFMVITVPDTFSTNLVSGQGDDPQRAQIMLQRNDANGFVIGSITNSAQSSIARAIDETAVRSYFDAVFANLKVIREGMQQAADGAGQLHDGALSAHDGAGQLASGLDTASTGAGTLASGLGELNSGAAKLSDGAQQVAAGTQQLADTLDPVLSLAADRLPGIQQQVGSAAAQVDSLAASIAGSTGSVASGITDAKAGLDALVSAHPELASDPAVVQLRERLTSASGKADAAATEAGRVASDVAAANNLLQNTGDLGQLATDAKAKVNLLNSGAHQVASGASELQTGTKQAATGATDLANGLKQLQDGSVKLNDGLGQLASGADELATQLTAGVKRMPVLTPDEQADAVQVLSAPVDVTMEVDNPAHVYGRGLAPMFFSIALWVLGISAFFLVRPITGRVITGRASDLRIAITAWLPLAGISVVAGWLMLAVAWIGLGLDPVRPILVIVVTAVVALAFSSVAHLLRTALGFVSTAAMLVVLIIQLTSAGGTYPAVLLPPVFAHLGHVMPMTYTINAFRITISGGLTELLVRDLSLMALLLASCLGTLVAVVHAKRRFRPRDLHPALG